MSSDHQSLADEKASLRFEAKRNRAALHMKLGDDAAFELADRAIDMSRLLPQRVVAAYLPHQTEINTIPLLERLSDLGVTCALPKVEAPSQPLSFRLWQQGGPLEVSSFGVKEPVSEAPELTPDLIFVPLLAYDRRGYRLGYGGGYYDRTLSALRENHKIVAIGLAFAGQEVARVPIEPHDMPLDGIVTEQDSFLIT